MGRVLVHSTLRGRRVNFAWLPYAVAAWVCLSAASAAAEDIQRQFPTTAHPSFLLHNHAGEISIQGWDESAIDLQGSAAGDASETLIEASEQEVSVKVHPKRDETSSKDIRVNFSIRVPRQAVVRIDSESGTISVANLDGSLTIEGVSTPVVLSQVKGKISIRTVDGPVQVRSSAGSINVDSISGNLQFVQVNGSELVANTNSGTIRYEGDFGDGGTYVLNNYSSPIDILASAKASFELTARAVTGVIQSSLSFSPTPLASAFRRLSPSKYLQGRFNAGDSTVRVTSYSGTIRVRGSNAAGSSQ